MSTTFTFHSACSIIKENYLHNEPKLIKAVDLLLGTAMVLSPVVLGPVAAPALALLGAKNEIVKIGKSVYDKLLGETEDEESVLSRQQRTLAKLLGSRLSSVLRFSG